MSEHTWFQENLAGYCAGGLSPEEGERFERHRIACSTCAKLLAEARGFDEAMDNLFAPIRPPAGWENRVIENVRASRAWRGLSVPRWALVAASVAALVVLGSLGAVLHGFFGKGGPTFPGMAGEYAAARLAAPVQEMDETRSMSRNDMSSVNGKLNINTIHDPQLLDVLADGEGNGKAIKDWSFSEKAPSSGAKSSDMDDKRVSSLAAGLGDKAIDNYGVDFMRREAVNESLPKARDLAEGLQEELTVKLRQMDEPALGRNLASQIVTWNESERSAGDRGDKESKAGDVARFGLEELARVNRSRNRNRGFSSNPTVNQPAGGVTDLGLKLSEANQSAPKYFSPHLPMAKTELAAETTPAEPSKAEKYGMRVEARAGAQAKEVKGQPAEAAQPELPPESSARKIIRTGTMEFEVDGFDAAVAAITRLVDGVKGGFVSTVNSDKLPNGKVKGSMVVRLPPPALDKFLLDVRRELSKSGELKSQRIGSQDVSKQYTDVESRLRGARAMEERFLQIIKTGKGEIKDLVAAENALGVWRTKIEEMEGEIRYYNNQVSLTTLTITLVEKEIQAAAVLVVSERVKMQLEVEDVEKAQQAALAAVAQAKGRVIKSELKQHAAGQLEAILHFDVAPAAAAKVREALKQLGIVTHQDSDRSQQAEGAGRQALESKIKQNDVRFEVAMYNVANIQPREVQVIQIATLDVPASFRKLQAAIAAAGGQVRIGQLNEHDKLNVSAQLDFDVPSPEKKAIDEALSGVGKIIARTATQAAPGEAATDRKIGYRLTLRNVAALPSREKISLGIEVMDVDQTAAEILELVKGRQGHVAGTQTNHERNGRVSAILVFDVPLTTKEELLLKLKTAGKIRLQTSTRNPQVPDNELATAHIDVTLTSSGPIVPSDEGLWPQIRTSLFYSFKLLSWSLMFVILGLSVILPWLLIVWLAYKLVSRWRKKPAAGSV